MSAELTVKQLTKQYASGMASAIDNISITIAAGGILALLGPSGCGKTTTLRCVAGLERPSGGTICIDGNLVCDPAQGVFVAPQHRNLGMVFQSYAVWPHMTVRQNVEYPLRNKALSRQAVHKQAAQALELVGLQDYADRSVVALSGGQMQRVALARSLSYRPALLLLDEPLSNLDAKLRVRLRDDLRKILKEAGVTALYVTHDQAEAVVIGDTIGVMKDGQLLQLDTPTALYNHPRDLFVAGFTGAASSLQAELRRDARGELSIFVQEVHLASLPENARHAFLAPGRIKLAIRPENVRLHVHGTHRGHTARITHRQYLGTQTQYTLALFGQSITTVELGTQPRFEDGQDVTAELPHDCLTIFPC